MVSNPLDPPESDAPVLPAFAAAYGLPLDADPLELLSQLARAFAQVPYENLTKILRNHEAGSAAEARRSPAEVVGDHLELGTGGTCFSLTSTFLHLVRALGWQAEPILVDRRYGADTHSALLVWINGQPHILDPGYLIVRPLPIPRGGELIIPTEFNQLVLTPRDGGRKVDLHTLHQKQKTYRLTFKTDPADPGTFLRAWDTSFGVDMMTYPVLTRVRPGEQIYLQSNRLQIRSMQDVQKEELDPAALVTRIAQEFGIDASIVQRALAVLHRKGELDGRAATG